MCEGGGVVDVEPVEVAAIDDLRRAFGGKEADAFSQRGAVELASASKKGCETAKTPVS